MKENIFHAVFEIVDQARSMNAQYERITREERQIAADYTRLYEEYNAARKAGTMKTTDSINAIKTAYEAKENKLNQNTHTKQIIKIILPILHDNAQAKARQDIQTNDAHDIDTHYTDKGIYTRHEYDGIRQTAFYKVESGSYCEFLSIAHSIEAKAREQAEMENGYKCA